MLLERLLVVEAIDGLCTRSVTVVIFSSLRSFEVYGFGAGDSFGWPLAYTDGAFVTKPLFYRR